MIILLKACYIDDPFSKGTNEGKYIRCPVWVLFGVSQWMLWSRVTLIWTWWENWFTIFSRVIVYSCPMHMWMYRYHGEILVRLFLEMTELETRKICSIIKTLVFDESRSSGATCHWLSSYVQAGSPSWEINGYYRNLVKSVLLTNHPHLYHTWKTESWVAWTKIRRG